MGAAFFLANASETQNMSSPPETSNMAVFCDFENIALGVNEVGYSKFKIDKVPRPPPRQRQHRPSKKRIATGAATNPSSARCTKRRSS